LTHLGDPHLKPRFDEELYDLTLDPQEARNVVSEPAYEVAAADLRLRLRQWMTATSDPLNQGFVACPNPELQYVSEVSLHPDNPLN
jgi:hypothetical protein